MYFYLIMEAYVSHRREGTCGILEFGNPAGNSLPGKLLDQLYKKLKLLEEDDQVAVILFQSSGNRAFCGGASFAEMKNLKTLNEATAFFMGFAKVINQIRVLNKFVIARVQGKVVGGGVGLVAACDYVIAHENAAIKLSELSIGIGPFVIEPAVSRKIGTTAFTQLSLDAERFKSAEWAKRKGLYNTVVPTEESLDQNVMENAHRLASYAPKAIKNLRKLHWKDTDHWKTLLPKNAEITAKLVLEEATQNILKSL
ncbi:enoyl-CoA hydratase/isomerase family protein [Flavobacteriaceae bacterium]|nr:enoyl-CoA hydratase/isomerase family protein [Flavobacteriaceae bacterium]MDC0386662.1 enoyl-CoA hydratase/isomerase family protein [Flavobacteriaceae bacterium]